MPIIQFLSFLLFQLNEHDVENVLDKTMILFRYLQEKV